MRDWLARGAGVLGLGLAAAGFIVFSTTPRASAVGANQPVTPTAYAYLPVVMKNFCPPVTPPPAGDWLAYVNFHRTLACLPPVLENPVWSDGALKHSIYMVKNDEVGHTEDSRKPFYTPEGALAAANSNVMVSGSTSTTDNEAIDLWMRGPFHAVGIIDPSLLQVGFGSYRENIGLWKMGATLDVIRGLGAVPTGVTFPVKWPSDGMIAHLRQFNGGEVPNPLTHPSCAGYTLPTGLPILLQLGDGSVTPAVTASSFMQGSSPLEHCRFDETNYSNPDPNLESLGRAVLAARDAVVLIPQNPLSPGATYTVSVTANGDTHTWSFSVSLTASDLGPAPDAQMRAPDERR